MKHTPFLLLGIGVALGVAGCDQAGGGGGGGGANVAELTKQVTAVQDQNRDLRAKIAAREAFPGRSPLDDFFKAPEFWQCTYDSSWSDCAARCSKATATGHQACLANHPEGDARKTCVEKNSADGASCLRNCPKQMSPINPAIC